MDRLRQVPSCWRWAAACLALLVLSSAGSLWFAATESGPAAALSFGSWCLAAGCFMTAKAPPTERTGWKL